MESSETLQFDSLLTVLRAATSTSTASIRSASDQLKKWQYQPVYYKYLQDVIGDHSLPFETRWLAAIELKHGIDRFWRKTAVHAVSEQDKAVIRAKCIEIGLRESDRRIAVQNALLVAKIVRIDYPNDWPNAVDKVLQVVQEAAYPDAPYVQLSAALLLLLTVVKELSTVRLMKTRRAFLNEGSKMVQVVGLVYTTAFSAWQSFLKDGGSDEAGAIRNMENSLLCLRLLRRLLVSAFEAPSRNEVVHDLWNSLSLHFEYLIVFVNEQSERVAVPVRNIIDRMILQMAKLHVSMVDSHPASFAQLPNALLISKLHWNLLQKFGASFGAHEFDSIQTIGSDPNDQEQQFEEKLSLKGLLLLRGCVKMVYNPQLTIKYQTDEDKAEKAASKNAIKQNLLSDDLVHQMMEIIVTKFFVYRVSDLQKWSEDPAEWERKEEGEGDSWKYSVRMCAEKLFLDLILNHKSLLIEPLLNVFRQVASLDNKNVLLKDSVYCSVGLAAPALTDKVDFNNFMTSTLIPEIQVHDGNYKILKRRASIMVAQWSVTGAVAADLVYQTFEYLLDNQQEFNDIVVRFTAGRQLKNAINPYENSSESLLPYGRTFFTRLMNLIAESPLIETKIALMNTVQTLVQSMEEGVELSANDIVDALPSIWEEAYDEYLLKQVILGLLSDLFRSMKGSSHRLHRQILPLIASALDQDNEARTYLLDDSVDLWSAVLAQATTESPEILSLWPLLFPLFETADENLRRALEITESYILLAPQMVLHNGSEQLWRMVNSLLRQALRRDARVSLCEISEQIVLTAERVGGKESLVAMLRTMEGLKFVHQLIDGLRKAYLAHQNPSPNAPKTDINGIIETQYVRIISRILLSDAGFFLQMLQQVASSTGGVDAEQLLQDLLTEIFSHYDSLNNPVASKLVAMGLASLLRSNDGAVSSVLRSRMQEVVSLWTAAVHECTYEGKDTLIWSDLESLKPPVTESPEQVRRREIEFVDPIRRVDLQEVITGTLSSLAERFGAAFQESLDSVDKDVLNQFQRLDMFATPRS